MSFLKSLVAPLTCLAFVVTACGPAAAPSPAPSTAVPAPKVETKAPASQAETKAAPKEPVRPADSASGESAKAPSKAAAAAPKETDAMAKYEAMVQAATKEGKIVVNGNQAYMREGLRESFGKKFGIDLDFLHLGPGDVFSRLRTERQAGQYTLDIVLSGPGTFILNMIPDGMLDRMDDVLVLPEVTDASKWLDGAIPWSDPEHKGLRVNKYVSRDISINTSIVSKGEIKTHKDLLDPKWKGKIAAFDPTILGAGAVIGAFLFVTFGEDFVKQFYLGQEVVLSRDDRQIGDWLARGRYPIIIWDNDRLMSDMQKDKLPVEVVVTEDVARLDAGSGAIGMLNKAPHPNAAKLFVNWLSSKEGQTAWLNMVGRPVTRADVDQSALPDQVKIKPGVKYVDSAGFEYLSTQRAKAQNRVRELIQR